jgi:two-component system, NtrC family, response regulator HydG
MPSVLIVDDLLSIHEMLDAVIQPTGFTTSFATNGENALARYKAEKFDIVLADIDMKPMDGITLLKQLKVYDPSCVLIIMTAYASTESAIQALKHGAFDYLQKPFRVDELIATLKRGIEFRQFQTEKLLESTHSLQPARSVEIETKMVGSSVVIKKLIQQVKKLTVVRTPVLLQGEEGTGKMTVTEVLHIQSTPADAPLVRLDCSQVEEGRLRDGLIGGNAGGGGSIIQEAKGGTLYLEQIHALPKSIQKDFVSVLRSQSSNFRLICSTTEDLESMVDAGKFHDELFYRVASIPVTLPPLRDRREDIPMLVKHFATQTSNPNVDVNLIEFNEEAMAILNGYRWPGNLTELRQIVVQVASSTDTRTITAHHLPQRLRDISQWPKLDAYLAPFRKKYIDTVLQACKGDKAKAAKVLGIDAAQID